MQRQKWDRAPAPGRVGNRDLAMHPAKWAGAWAGGAGTRSGPGIQSGQFSPKSCLAPVRNIVSSESEFTLYQISFFFSQVLLCPRTHPTVSPCVFLVQHMAGGQAEPVGDSLWVSIKSCPSEWQGAVCAGPLLTTACVVLCGAWLRPYLCPADQGQGSTYVWTYRPLAAILLQPTIPKTVSDSPPGRRAPCARHLRLPGVPQTHLCLHCSLVLGPGACCHITGCFPRDGNSTVCHLTTCF